MLHYWYTRSALGENARHLELSGHHYLRTVAWIEWYARVSNTRVLNIVLGTGSKNILSERKQPSILPSVGHTLRVANTSVIWHLAVSFLSPSERNFMEVSR